MALQKAMVPIDLSGSIDTKTDQKLVLPTNLVELENGVFTRGSVVTKRYGYDALGTEVLDGTALPTGEALTSLEDELLAFGSNKLYSYASGLTKWIDRGGFRSVDATSADIIRNENEQSATDSAESNGIIVYAWEDTSGGIRASVVDSGNDVVILEDVQLTNSGTLPRCVAQGKNLTVLYVDTVSGSIIKSRQINTDNPQNFATAKSVASDISTGISIFDVHQYDTTADDSAVLAYADNSNTLRVCYITNTGEQGTLANGFPNIVTISTQPEDAISIYADKATATDIYVAVSKNSDSSGLKVFRLDTDLSTTANTASGDATEIKRIGMVYNSAGNLDVYYEHSAAQTYNHLLNLRVYDTSANSIGSATVVMRSVGLVSRPFLYNGTSYIFVLHESSLQPTYFLIDSSGLVLAKFKQSSAGALPTRPVPSSWINISSGIFELPVQVTTRLESRDNDIYGLKGLARIKADFVGGRTFLNKELGKVLVLGGGFLSQYDSQVIDELGFHIFPENVTSGTATSGGSLADGTYSYKVIYVYQDAKGHIHRSAPSVAKSQAASGGGSSINTITIPTLRITDHANVTIEVYRTVAAGTVYYKIGTVANDTSADTVSFADNGAINDTNLVAKENLYTTGGILENISPPAISVLGTFGQRMFAVSSENPNVLHFSKQQIGNNAIDYSDTFTITVPEAKEITGLQAMDEKLIIFEEDRIFAMTGAGPTTTGDQNDFSDPALITSDAGCSEPRSLVLIPQGIMFQSNKGIYLLNRSLETVYVGAPVEAFNNQIITSAELLQDQNQVRFLSSDGTTLVYDYFFNKWSTFSDHQGSGATVWVKTGNYVYLRTNGEVWQQSLNYTDNGARFPLKLTTAWIKTNNIQGLQRCRKAFVLGDYKSKHNLRVQVGFDYQQSFQETHNFNYSSDLGIQNFGDENPFGSEVFGGGTSEVADGVYQFRMNLGKQKCESIRFSIADGEDSGSTAPEIGQSYSISNLMLEVGIKPTGMKLPQQKLV